MYYPLFTFKTGSQSGMIKVVVFYLDDPMDLKYSFRLDKVYLYYSRTCVNKYQALIIDPRVSRKYVNFRWISLKELFYNRRFPS